MTNELPEMAKALARDRVARHRAGRRRIDYAPAPDVLAYLDQVMADSPGASYREVLDHLLRAAETTLS